MLGTVYIAHSLAIPDRHTFDQRQRMRALCTVHLLRSAQHLCMNVCADFYRFICDSQFNFMYKSCRQHFTFFPCVVLSVYEYQLRYSRWGEKLLLLFLFANVLVKDTMLEFNLRQIYFRFRKIFKLFIILNAVVVQLLVFCSFKIVDSLRDICRILIWNHSRTPIEHFHTDNMINFHSQGG